MSSICWEDIIIRAVSILLENYLWLREQVNLFATNHVNDVNIMIAIIIAFDVIAIMILINIPRLIIKRVLRAVRGAILGAIRGLFGVERGKVKGAKQSAAKGDTNVIVYSNSDNNTTQK